MGEPMTFTEEIHNAFLSEYAKLVMPKGEPEGRTLVYANIGLGDLVFMLPVLRALDNDKTTICLDDDSKRDFLRMAGIHKALIFHTEYIGYHEYDTVICNFQQQWTPIIRQIIRRRIPCRIGHHWRSKYGWLWTYPIPHVKTIHVKERNKMLLWPFHLEATDKPIEVGRSELGWDILIAPHSNWPEKDWPHFQRLWAKLMNRGYTVCLIESKWPMNRLLREIAGAKLVIGNDSGIPKVADAMGINAIQIFRKDAPGPELWGAGLDIIEPTVEDVFNQARNIIEAN